MGQVTSLKMLRVVFVQSNTVYVKNNVMYNFQNYFEFSKHESHPK